VGYKNEALVGSQGDNFPETEMFSFKYNHIVDISHDLRQFCYKMKD